MRNFQELTIYLEFTMNIDYYRTSFIFNLKLREKPKCL